MRWEDCLPVLERKFVRARTKAELAEALRQFANSLHNPHVYYNPPNRPRRLTPGFRLDLEWVSGRPLFYVVDVTSRGLERRLRPGDVLVSYEGIAAERLPKRLHLWSNQNNWFGISRHLARLLSLRRVLGPAPPPARWVFERREADGDTRRFGLTLPWREPSPARTRRIWDQSVVEYGRLPCRAGPHDYGAAYELVAQGVGFCFYTSKVPPYRDYPIVRQHSFLYSVSRPGRREDLVSTFQFVAADWDHLRRLLDAQRGLKGVVLDLRDNRGGNNPNWFLDWWAPGPYKDHYVRLRLHRLVARTLREQAERTRDVSTFAQIRGYLEAWRSRRPGRQFAPPRPFFCTAGDCGWSNVYRPAHRLTDKPVALLVGPGCVSSCDHFAQVFSEYGFGPVIGEPTSAGYTVARQEVRIAVGRHRHFGFMMLAVSYEVSGKSGRPVEAVPIRLTKRIPRTRKNRRTYGWVLVEAAIRELRGRR